jgi:hypothetical protein
MQAALTFPFNALQEVPRTLDLGSVQDLTELGEVLFGSLVISS